jgi:peptide subunit release factor 1 (eRF1)
MEDHVRGGLDRSRTRGLAMFSCTADGFWKVVELPVPVRDQVVVNHSPSVRQLETVIDVYERFGVLLVDRQRARMFVFELGELVEKSEAFVRIPRDEDDDRSYTRERAADHQAAALATHLRHAAKVAFDVYQHAGFDRLILSAPGELVADLETALHPYLRDRVEARCSIAVGATDEEIRSAALAVEADVARAAEAELVGRLREAAGGRRRGVTGLDDTLKALAERRVETLVVSAGYAAPGWRCGGCGVVARVGRACPVCEASMDEVDDVVEEALDEALAQSCQVEVCVGNADLDVLGRIGALLRY